MEEKAGRLIVFEGLDGSGKSTQARITSDYLRKLGLKVNLSSEPSPGPIGSVIRQALTHRINLSPETLAALFAADRLDHINNPINGIVKHLSEGVFEISDRYDLTSYAYQTQYVNPTWVWQLNSQVIRPDLTIFLDISPKECLKRLYSSSIEQDIFHEQKHLEEARERYFEAIEKLRNEKKENISVVSADGMLSDITNEIIDIVRKWLDLED